MKIEDLSNIVFELWLIYFEIKFAIICFLIFQETLNFISFLTHDDDQDEDESPLVLMPCAYAIPQAFSSIYLQVDFSEIFINSIRVQSHHQQKAFSKEEGEA